MTHPFRLMPSADAATVAMLLSATFCLLTSSASAGAPGPVMQPPITPPASSNSKFTPVQDPVSNMLEAVQRASSAALKERKASIASKLSPQERGERVVAAFLSAAGVTVADLNQARAKRTRPEGKAVGYTLEGFMLQNLASIAYAYHEPELVEVARRQGIDFTQDGFAALLARTAGMDDNKRMQAMVDALTDPSLTDAETIELPMYLGRFGRSARRYAARRLADLPTTASGTDSAKLKDWLKYKPKVTPTLIKDQGLKGRIDSKRGYIGPLPDRAPSLTPGQAFLYLPGEDALVLTDTVTGETVPTAAYVFKKLTLQAVESSRAAQYVGETPLRLQFTVAGYPNPVVWEGEGDLYDLPSLHPLAEDATVRNLRARYQNKAVWGYGGSIGVEALTAVPQSALSLGLDNDARRGAAIVRHIFRLRSGSPFIRAIGSSPGYAGERSSSFATREPLVVVLELPSGVRPPPMSDSSSFIAVSGDELRDSDNLNSKAMMDRLLANKQHEMKPLAYYAVFADAWDFEREYSLISFNEASKKWPIKFRKAVVQRELIRGMTPEMTAWVMGFPGEYGTKEETLRASRKEWRYDDIPPFDHLVYFKNGVVSGWYRAQLP